MSYNVPGGDVLQAELERKQRLYDQLASTGSETSASRKTKRIVTEGLDYVQVAPFHNYPVDFYLGGERLARLNKVLLKEYRRFHDLMNDFARCHAILEANGRSIPQFQVEELVADTGKASFALRKAVDGIVGIIQEIDAIGGSNAYHIPEMFRHKIDVAKITFRAESGSLAYLEQKPHYVSEECKVPDYIDISKATPDGHSNRKQKHRIENVASHMNRIAYLEACNCNDDVMQKQQKNLREALDKVIKHTKEGGLAIDPSLRKKADNILSAADEKQEMVKAAEEKRKNAEEKRKNDEALKLLVRRTSQSRESYYKLSRDKADSANEVHNKVWRGLRKAQKRLKVPQAEHLLIKKSIDKFRYPDNFSLGEGRVSVLNTSLVPYFSSLLWLIEMEKTAMALEEALAKTTARHSFLASVNYYKIRIGEVSSEILEFIGEIDAIGGQYYVPPPLRDHLGMPKLNYRAPRGSLTWLCQPDSYVPEKYPLPAGTPNAAIKSLMSFYEELAFAVNRLNYFGACHVRNDRVLELEEKLRCLFPSFPIVVESEEFPIPKKLWVELSKILSKLERK